MSVRPIYGFSLSPCPCLCLGASFPLYSLPAMLPRAEHSPVEIYTLTAYSLIALFSFSVCYALSSSELDLFRIGIPGFLLRLKFAALVPEIIRSQILSSGAPQLVGSCRSTSRCLSLRVPLPGKEDLERYDVSASLKFLRLFCCQCLRCCSFGNGSSSFQVSSEVNVTLEGVQIKGFFRHESVLQWMASFPHLPPSSVHLKQFQQEPTKRGLPKKSGNKFDHLVLGPAAGQGLSNRLQCEGTKALNKTQFSTNHRVNAVELVSVVTVFSVYNSSPDASRVTVGNTSYSKVERAMAILNVFVNFIQETMPQSDVIILTDPASDLYVNRRGVSVYPIQGEYSREKLMLQRIRSYIAFLEKKLKEHNQKDVHHYIFTDSDIAVVDDLGQIFHDYPDFHLALTFRNNKQQPLNSGCIAVRGTRDGITRATAFLRKVLEAYTSKYMSASRMLGDQLALAWVVASEPSFDVKRYTRSEPFMQDIGSGSVLFLPCAIYNWTPPEGAGQFHGMPLDVKVSISPWVAIKPSQTSVLCYSRST
ncbi:hypothetical protein CRG98_009200 [Punica granatum]|uniref:Nucleotide-diphospho-sugar transferase domain-containing protein n=1 Tax=Punica granatum TaxID=22663 RepID=A0A2I0KPK6_PUNGR|nr:hypothetical protein CRG98_009200 [Punica granatum]